MILSRTLTTSLYTYFLGTYQTSRDTKKQNKSKTQDFRCFINRPHKSPSKDAFLENVEINHSTKLTFVKAKRKNYERALLLIASLEQASHLQK